jgi:raffinose/stachyose/melibiose transport system substrate-binding protein
MEVKHGYEQAVPLGGRHLCRISLVRSRRMRGWGWSKLGGRLRRALGLSSVALWDGLTAAYAEANPDVKVTVETHPSGGEADNLIKTRLATGEMNDLFWYNSGSLFQALNPDQTLVPLNDEPWVDSLEENFKTVVSTDEAIYGAPVGASFAAGVIYNKDIYEQLGLSVPTTWAEFEENNQKVKDAGLVPLVQTYGDTWTSQIPILGDFYNVQSEDPEWAEKYTANEAKFANEPALAGFQHLQEAHESDFLNAIGRRQSCSLPDADQQRRECHRSEFP